MLFPASSVGFRWDDALPALNRVVSDNPIQVKDARGGAYEDVGETEKKETA